MSLCLSADFICFDDILWCGKIHMNMRYWVKGLSLGIVTISVCYLFSKVCWAAVCH